GPGADDAAPGSPRPRDCGGDFGVPAEGPARPRRALGCGTLHLGLQSRRGRDPMTGPDLVVRLAEFAGELRARGVRVGLSDELDAATALTLVDLLDRDEVRRALEIALKIQPADRGTFGELFHRFWADAGE